jgi:hypothetical protein
MIVKGVTEYNEGLDVEVGWSAPDRAWVIRADNEGGFNSTAIDLWQLMMWLHNNYGIGITHRFSDAFPVEGQ